MVCLIGENSKFGDVLAQSVGKAIEHDGKKDDGNDGKPDVVLVGLQSLDEAVVVGQCGADDEFLVWKVCSRNRFRVWVLNILVITL